MNVVQQVRITLCILQKMSDINGYEEINDEFPLFSHPSCPNPLLQTGGTTVQSKVSKRRGTGLSNNLVILLSQASRAHETLGGQERDQEHICAFAAGKYTVGVHPSTTISACFCNSVQIGEQKREAFVTLWRERGKRRDVPGHGQAVVESRW